MRQNAWRIALYHLQASFVTHNTCPIAQESQRMLSHCSCKRVYRLTDDVLPMLKGIRQPFLNQHWSAVIFKRKAMASQHIRILRNHQYLQQQIKKLIEIIIHS